ncbi:MAG: nuclear transport factor 2 family protein [Caulobacterales bacterium]
MDIQSVADEQEIRRLGAAYADACNRLCAEDAAACFAPDGTMGRMGEKAVPGDKMLKMYTNLFNGCEFLFQSLHSGLVELNGGRAKARWWMNELLRQRHDMQWRVNYGMYEDELVRLEGGWRFASRRFALRATLKLNEADMAVHPAFQYAALTPKMA